MAGDSNLHVVMFPWLAFGHFIPFLELSKFIAQKGHKVTFISTPRNIDRLPKIPPDLTSLITFVKIPLPKVEGLPENAEATVDLRAEDVPFLKIAYDRLEPDLTRFLENSVPDWIIYDVIPYWIPPVAAKLGILNCHFCIYSASSFVFFGPSDMMLNGTDERKKAEDFLVPPKWVPFETKLAYKHHEVVNWVIGANQKNESGVSDLYRGGMVRLGADVIIVRHCYEFEGKWLRLLQEMEEKLTILPIGLMPPNLKIDCYEGNESWAFLKEWLDSQENESVLYVALGSEVTLSQTDVTELAHGLDLSGVPFLWILRKPSESTELIELPDGFEVGVKGRGIVWKSWAPQVNILSHDSVGGFLTHCGWSSSIEGLTFGRPLVLLPFILDTGLIARIMEENHVGVEVPRNERDGSYMRNSVAESVRLVMVENEGKSYRDTAKKMSAIIGDRELQDGYVHNFISYLENNSRKFRDY